MFTILVIGAFYERYNIEHANVKTEKWLEQLTEKLKHLNSFVLFSWLAKI